MAKISKAAMRAQQLQYEDFARRVSKEIAIFYNCVKFDVPFDSEFLPKTDEAPVWEAYLEALWGSEHYGDANPLVKIGFADGQTDISKIGGTKGSLSKKMTGTAAQVRLWGEGFTTEEYRELDRVYAALASDHAAAGGVTVKQDFILRDCAKLTLERDKAIARAEFENAAKLNKMIQDLLASEGLRKKDAKPIDNQMISGIAAYLEKNGFLKDGEFCDPNIIFNSIFGEPPKYPYTKDAAEQMILINTNCMRRNNGLSEWTELPDEFRLVDNLDEFATAQNKAEKEAYKELGLVKMAPPKKKKRKKPKKKIDPAEFGDFRF